MKITALPVLPRLEEGQYPMPFRFRFPLLSFMCSAKHITDLRIFKKKNTAARLMAAKLNTSTTVGGARNRFPELFAGGAGARRAVPYRRAIDQNSMEK